jgi:hypothetical protein
MKYFLLLFLVPPIFLAWRAEHVRQTHWFWVHVQYADLPW